MHSSNTAAADQHDASTAPTVPPPPMPRMSARDDSPRLVTRPGADSRYHRARAGVVALEDGRAQVRANMLAAAEPESDCERCDDTGRHGANVDGADVEVFCGQCDLGVRLEDDYLESNGLSRINGTKRHAPEPSLAAQLAGSLELLAAIERVDVVAGHTLAARTCCPCGASLTRCCRVERADDYAQCSEVYVLDGRAFCSLECLACELGEEHTGAAHVVVDAACIARIVDLVRASFARKAGAR